MDFFAAITRVNTGATLAEQRVKTSRRGRLVGAIHECRRAPNDSLMNQLPVATMVVGVLSARPGNTPPHDESNSCACTLQVDHVGTESAAVTAASKLVLSLGPCVLLRFES